MPPGRLPREMFLARSSGRRRQWMPWTSRRGQDSLLRLNPTSECGRKSSGGWKMPLWCERSSQWKDRRLKYPSLNAQQGQPWRRMATAAGDHTRGSFWQLTTGRCGENSQRLTANHESGFQFQIQMVASEFGVNNMKVRIHLVLYQRFTLVRVV